MEESSEKIIHFRGEITFEIYQRAQKTHFGLRWLYWFLFPILMTIWSYYMDPLRRTMEALTLRFAIYSIIFITIMFLSTWYNFRKTYKNSPYLQEECSGYISQESLHLENHDATVNIPWRKFVKVKFKDELVMLYRGPNIFNMLPKEFFRSEEDWNNAVDLIRQTQW